MKAVAPPRMAITHIQNTAPGPPTEIATATPATLPVPTRDAAEMVNALNAEMPPYSSSSSAPTPLGRSTMALNISGTIRICTTAVRKPKKRPAAMSSHGRTHVHRVLLIAPSTVLKISCMQKTIGYVSRIYLSHAAGDISLSPIFGNSDSSACRARLPRSWSAACRTGRRVRRLAHTRAESGQSIRIRH